MTETELVDVCEDIAVEIERLSKLYEAFDQSRLTRRAIVLLIKDITGIKMSTIGVILDALPRLKEHFLKEPDEEAEPG